MALRRLLRCLPVAALVVCASTGCKDKGDATTQGTTTDLDKRCEQLAKTCGDTAKHVEKLSAECKQAAKTQADSGCGAKAIALYDCYEKDLCGGGDKVWTLDDLRVLGERHSKCVAEQTAARDCGAKK